MITIDGEGGVWIRPRQSGKRYPLPSRQTVGLWGALALIMAIALAGCAKPSAQVSSMQAADYEAQVRQAIRDTYVDPGSIRDAEISEPFPVAAVFDGITPFPHSGDAVCVIANSRNRMGGYTGRQPHLFLFKNGRIDLSIGGADFQLQAADHCARGRYRPMTKTT